MNPGEIGLLLTAVSGVIGALSGAAVAMRKARSDAEGAAVTAAQGVVKLLHDELDALNVRLAQLERQLDDEHHRFDDCSEQYRLATLRIGELEAENARLKCEVASLRHDVSKVERQVNASNAG